MPMKKQRKLAMKRGGAKMGAKAKKNMKKKSLKSRMKKY